MRRSPLLFAPLLAACAMNAVSRGDFSLQRAASTAGELGAIAERVSHAHAPPLPSLAVLVSSEASEGFAIHALPDGRRLGHVRVPLTSRPLIAGDLVLARVGAEVVAYGTDGAARWRVPSSGLELLGASRDGELVAFTLGGRGVSRRDSVLYVVDAASGSVRIRRADGHALGIPALVGDDLALPWDGQNLSIFSVSQNTEIARVRSRDDVIGWALREGPSLWFGARVLYRFDRAATSGARDGSTQFRFERDDLPGAAPFALDGYTSLRAGGDARERVRLLWRPDPAATDARVAGQTVYALFHQVVFGLDAGDGAVRWAHLHNANLVGAEATTQGALVVDEVGNLLVLDAQDGHVSSQIAVGGRCAQAVLQIGAAETLAGAGERPPSSRTDALLRVAQSTETRLLPARLFAVKALTRSDDPAAVSALVDIVTSTSTPPEIRAAAGEAIARRTTPSDAVRTALEARYDYVRNTPAPPVGFLARGAASAGDRRCTLAIAAHLLDPATPTAELPALASSLRQLGDDAAVPALDEFVRRYHADIGQVVPPGGTDAIEERDLGEQALIDSALEQAIEGLARLAGPRAESLLVRVEAHPSTPDPVRSAAARGVALIRAASAAANPSEPAASGGDAAPSPSAAPSTPTAPPSTAATNAIAERGVDLTISMSAARLTQQVIDEAMAELRPRLLACLRGAPSRPAQVRIQFRYEGDGRIGQVVVLPTSFTACMGAVVRSLTLPSSAAHRELGTYTFSTM